MNCQYKGEAVVVWLEEEVDDGEEFERLLWLPLPSDWWFSVEFDSGAVIAGGGGTAAGA